MRRGGFSLIEISVVLIVVSVMISGILPYISESQKTNAANDTMDRIEAIETAMLTYRAANGFIPCPSNIQATLNSAAFGTADVTASCAAATNFTDANTAAGGVPTKTLGLPDEMGFDGWGRRMVYHVAKALTVAGTYGAGVGSITVNDAAGTARTTAAAYAIVSHGPNGHGAYTRAGGTARFSFGSTNASEQENCECNATATATAYDSILAQFMATPNTNPLAAYDDIVRYTLKPNLELLVGGGGTGSCTGIAPSGWPDAIKCSNGIYDVSLFYQSNTTAAGFVEYALLKDSAVNRGYIRFVDSTKAYSGHVDLAGYDCVTGTMAITALEAAGKTFSFCGGSGGGAAGGYWTAGTGGNINDIYNANSGNVGIGTTTPVAKLDVNGGINYKFATATDSNGVAYETTTQNFDYTNASGTYKLNHYGMTAASMPGSAATYVSGYGELALFTQGANRLHVNQAGNVGIGTASPASPLHVAATTANMMLDSAVNGDAGVILRENTSQRWHIYNQGTIDYLYVVDADYSAGSYMTQNQVGWAGYSDRRIKKNIKSYRVLDRIDGYRAVSFDWKLSDTHDVGVIAQEIVDAFPEVVDKGDDDTARDIKRVDEKGVWGVHYDKLGALALQGVKELNEKVEALGGKAVSESATKQGDQVKVQAVAIPDWLKLLLGTQSLAIVGLGLAISRRK